MQTRVLCTVCQGDTQTDTHPGNWVPAPTDGGGGKDGPHLPIKLGDANRYRGVLTLSRKE